MMCHQQLVQQVGNPFLKADSISTFSQSSDDALLGFRLYENTNRRLSMSARLSWPPITLRHHWMLGLQRVSLSGMGSTSPVWGDSVFSWLSRLLPISGSYSCNDRLLLPSARHFNGRLQGVLLVCAVSL